MTEDYPRDDDISLRMKVLSEYVTEKESFVIYLGSAERVEKRLGYNCALMIKENAPDAVVLENSIKSIDEHNIFEKLFKELETEGYKKIDETDIYSPKPKKSEHYRRMYVFRKK